LKNDFILGALQTRRGQLKGTNGLQKERSDWANVPCTLLCVLSPVKDRNQPGKQCGMLAAAVTSLVQSQHRMLESLAFAISQKGTPSSSTDVHEGQTQYMICKMHKIVFLMTLSKKFFNDFAKIHERNSRSVGPEAPMCTSLLHKSNCFPHNLPLWGKLV
jgi:hypothetical protein